MEFPDIHKNYSLLYHFPTKIKSNEILKFLKYYSEIKSWVMLGSESLPCCHDIYVNRTSAIILKVTTIYFPNIKLILHQAIYQSDVNQNPSYLPSINYNEYDKLNSFFWSSIKSRNYKELSRAIPINSKRFEVINRQDEYLLNKIMKQSEKSFQNIERAIFYPFLWSKDNDQINKFNEKFPLRKFQKYFKIT